MLLDKGTVFGKDLRMRPSAECRCPFTGEHFKKSWLRDKRAQEQRKVYFDVSEVFLGGGEAVVKRRLKSENNRFKNDSHEKRNTTFLEHLFYFSRVLKYRERVRPARV